MSDYADIDMEFRNYRDRIADLEARIAALEAALREATLILEQAQCCILHETPEDMTCGEAEDDTLSKIRAFLHRAVP
jgi:N-methylhydantoinase B/oxoprolinase/acetone carboxylase alpha subunit